MAPSPMNYNTNGGDHFGDAAPDMLSSRTGATRQPRPVQRHVSRQGDDGLAPLSSVRSRDSSEQSRSQDGSRDREQYSNNHQNGHNDNYNGYNNDNYNGYNNDNYNHNDDDHYYSSAPAENNHQHQQQVDDDDYYTSGVNTDDDEAALADWYNSSVGGPDSNDEMMEIKMSEERRKVFYTRVLLCLYFSLAIFTSVAIGMAMAGNASVDHCKAITHPIEACACSASSGDGTAVFVGITDEALEQRSNMMVLLQNASVLGRDFNETAQSCSMQNQALNFVSEPSMYPIGAWLDNERQVLQRYVLALLYLQTGGSGWNSNDNWVEAITECNWHGVNCFDKAVIEIDLMSNGLDGAIPMAELHSGLSPFLRTLDLRHNEAAKGTLLDSTNDGGLFSIGMNESSSGSRLRGLYLSGTGITGTIPTEIESVQGFLEELELSLTNLTGGLDALTSLSNLERLDVSQTSFSSTIPTALGDLSHLVYLNISSTGLTGIIPSEVALLSNLRFVDFGSNPGLTGTVPAAVCTIVPLETAVVDCDNGNLDVSQCTCCSCSS